VVWFKTSTNQRREVILKPREHTGIVQFFMDCTDFNS